MKTTTSTQVTHYEIQKKRRESLLEEWRGYHKKVIKRSDVSWWSRRPRGRDAASTPAGTATGRRRISTRRSTRSIRATTTTIHRHSWDAIMFVESGSGWTEIDGQRIDWKPWDTLHLPGWAWHRHGNEGDKTAVFHTWSVQPMLEQFGVALLEDGGDTPVSQLPPRPQQITALTGDDPYARRTQRLARQWEGNETRG